MRLEEGADHNQNAISGSREGHSRFLERLWYPTPGWIQPPDKPVSVFDGIGPDPCLTPGYPPPYINRLPFIVLKLFGGVRPRITTRVVTPRGWHHDSDSRRDLMRWIDTKIRDLIRRPACSCDTRRVPTTTRTVWASDSDTRRGLNHDNDSMRVPDAAR